MGASNIDLLQVLWLFFQSTLTKCDFFNQSTLAIFPSLTSSFPSHTFVIVL